MTEPLLIPDISRYVPDVDMHAAQAGGVPAIIAKCSEGTSYVDPTWNDFYTRAHAVPLIFGGYHYLLPGDPAGQMDHFLDAAHLQPGDLQPIVDAESKGLGKTDTVAALDYLTAQGYRPLLYASLSFWQETLDSVRDYPLWVAAYRATLPPLPSNLTLFAWQFSDRFPCPGVAQPCDCSHFYGDLADLQRFCIPMKPIVIAQVGR